MSAIPTSAARIRSTSVSRSGESSASFLYSAAVVISCAAGRNATRSANQSYSGLMSGCSACAAVDTNSALERSIPRMNLLRVFASALLPGPNSTSLSCRSKTTFLRRLAYVYSHSDCTFSSSTVNP